MRVGVIGCGYWGPNLIRNLLENRKCAGVTVCDPDPASLARARHRFPTVECVESVDDLLRDRAVGRP